MILTYIASFTLLILIIPAASQNGTYMASSNCDAVASMAAANATGSTPFAGVRVDSSTGRIGSDSSSNWTFGASLTVQGGTSSTQTNLGFWLDTSATVGTNDTVLPYNACVAVILGAPQRGDPEACLEASCLKALNEQYKAGAMQIVEQMRQGNSAYMDARDACKNLVTLMAPDECKGATTQYTSTGDASWGSMGSSAPSLNPLSTSNCTPSQPSIPRPLFGTGYGPDPPGNFSTYDRAVSTSLPFIIALWSNSTSIAAMNGKTAGEPWADVRTGCVRPGTVKAGSRVPTSGVSGKSSPWEQSAIWGAALLVVLMTSSAFG